MEPFVLAPNPVPRFYRGGPAIGAFRGVGGWDARSPEDWVGSCTCVAGSSDLGLSRLPGGRTLADAVAADPDAFVGPDHAASFGPHPALLVKLLHSGERLPVHWHPDRAFAARHLGSRYGKTEAWAVLEAEAGSSVHLGFRRDVPPGELRRWVDEQHAEEVLDAMHELPVRAGDTFLVPAGVPHAIGAGILLVELQEPTDLSVLLEWKGFDVDGPSEGHLGLGFDVALRSARTTALTDGEIERLRSGRPGERPASERLFPEEADVFFRAERLIDGAELPAGFSILVVVEGDGELASAATRLPVRRGETVLVPFGAGDTRLRGDVAAIRCAPAIPEAA